MPMATKETIKLYLVVSLAVVALVVAYFRFFYEKEEPVTQAAASRNETAIASSPVVTGKVYKIGTTKKRPEVRTRKTQEKQRLSFLVEIKDIFEPPPIPSEAIQVVVPAGRVQRAPKKTAPEDIPLVLSGTLIGGKKPMAVINEKFIRLGEKIDIFRVVRIEVNRVVLKAGDHVRILTVLKPEEHLK
jgi:hypothetical protein